MTPELYRLLHALGVRQLAAIANPYGLDNHFYSAVLHGAEAWVEVGTDASGLAWVHLRPGADPIIAVHLEDSPQGWRVASI
jgi:hypothetical protein